MVDVNKVKNDIVKLNKSMLKMGFDWDFINRFWDETIAEVKNETKA